MKPFILLCLILVGSQVAQATHIIGGYIQAKPVSALTYEITVVMYMNEGPAATQADAVPICFGDGMNSVITRQSRVFSTDKSYSVNTYRTNHTYVGPGTYILVSSNPSWTTGKNTPNTETQLFTLKTTFTTNTAILNQTPVPILPTEGFVVGISQKVTRLLKATDAEGDSLVYSLARPLSSPLNEGCTYDFLPFYQFPNDLTRQGVFTLNNRTAELIWNAPVEPGYYALALNIDEYRNGVFISQTLHVLTLTATDLPGTPAAAIPPYIPASVGPSGLIITATEPSDDSDIRVVVFPNPVDDRLQVVIQTRRPATATLQLMDNNGRLIHKLAFDRTSRQHEQVIGMGSLTPGTYLLRADVDGRSLTRKIVKR